MVVQASISQEQIDLTKFTSDNSTLREGSILNYHYNGA